MITQPGTRNLALENLTRISISSHFLYPPVPRKNWPRSPHVPLIMLGPVVNSFSSEVQKLAVASLCFSPPTSATPCTSVMKEPSTVSASRYVLNWASSVRTLIAKLGVDRNE